MIFYPITAIINAITSTIVCIIVIAKNPKSQLNRSFSYFALSVAFWSYCYFLWQLSDNAGDALFWCRALMAGAIFIPSTFLHFSLTLIGERKKYLKAIIFWYIVSIVFLLLDFTPLFVKDIRPRLYFPYWPTAGITYTPFLAMFTGLTIYAHALMYKGYSKLSGFKRNQIKYVFLGTAIGFLGGSTNYPLWYDIPIPPIGNILVAVYVFVIAYAIAKYRLMDIKVAVTRAGIFIVVYALVLGLPFWLGFKTGLWIWALILMGISASCAPFIYRALYKRADAILLAAQRHYQKLLVDASRGMTRQRSLDKLVKLIVHVVKKAVKVVFAAVFLEDKEKQTYTLRAVRDHKNIPYDIVFPYEHPLVKALKAKKAPLTYEQAVPLLREESFNSPVDLVVPCFMDEELLGFLILGEKQNRTFFTEDDIRVFRVLAAQSALAIENCCFFKDREKIFTAEKLASIGGMADGVAHQVRNRLNCFGPIIAELQLEIEEFIEHRPQLASDPELKKALDAIMRASEDINSQIQRTAEVIKGILDYARIQEKETFFAEFSLREIINNVKDLVQVKHQIAELPLFVELPDNSSLIYGIKSQILECIYNIIDNAYEAIEELIEYYKLKKQENKSFKPFIKIRLSQRLNSYLIEISDNGIGVKEQDKMKIGAPLFTTKPSVKSGMGIGMYVAKRMIEENHKGKVWFESEYMKGTTFYIELPKKKG